VTVWGQTTLCGLVLQKQGLLIIIKSGHWKFLANGNFEHLSRRIIVTLVTGATTVGQMTLTKTTFSKMILSITDTQDDNTLYYAEWHNAECCILFIVVPSVVMVLWRHVTSISFKISYVMMLLYLCLKSIKYLLKSNRTVCLFELRLNV